MLSDKWINRLFSFFSIVVAIIIVMRLFHLQIIEVSKYKKFVKSQSDSSITVSKNRGLIYDKDNNVVAQNKVVGSLYAFRKNIDDKDFFINQLNSNGITVSDKVNKQLSDHDGFIWIKRHVDLDRAELLKSSIQGLEYYKEEARFYPEGSMLSNVIGFTGIDNQGRAGIEYMLDSYLTGEMITVASIKDSYGRSILFDDKTTAISPDSSIHLSVSSKIQAVSESILRLGADQYGAKNGVAIALDVKTGEIIFAASVKEFDPHNYSYKERFSYKDMPFTYLMEPGSIFKTVAYAYMQENAMINHQKDYDTSKMVTIAGFTYTDTKYFPSLKPEEIFIYSSNIGMSKLVAPINSNSYYNFIRKAGFGSKTGVYGVNEESGVIRNSKKWSKTSKTSISIGYELLTTPIQIVNFYAAIANYGIMTSPRIISYIDHHGDIIQPESSAKRIMTKETASYLIDLMNKTVKKGTGRNAKSSIINIAGKTGTVQKYDSITKEYSHKNYIASFAGIFPAEDPKVAMVVIYDSPSTSIYGGSTSAHIFKQLAEYLTVEMKLLTPSITRIVADAS